MEKDKQNKAKQKLNATESQYAYLGPMINSIHGGHISKQCLSSTYIASCLLPFNVLLPSLQSKPIGKAALSIL